MSVPTPHFLLYSAAKTQTSTAAAKYAGCRQQGQWEFVLESADGSARFEAADQEDQVAGQRLELLAVVRGLEALDQPSCVTLVTSSDYVRRGLRFGIPQWRESGWRWEFFGRMVPVRNADLWRRVDRALQIHRVSCRTLRFDGPAAGPPARRRGHRPTAATALRCSWVAPLRHLLHRLLCWPGHWLEHRYRVSLLCAD